MSCLFVCFLEKKNGRKEKRRRKRERERERERERKKRLRGALYVLCRVPKPSGGFFDIEDLKIGTDITLYSRTFHITACDPHTRSFLLHKGIEVPDDEDLPQAPLQEVSI